MPWELVEKGRVKSHRMGDSYTTAPLTQIRGNHIFPIYFHLSMQKYGVIEIWPNGKTNINKDYHFEALKCKNPRKSYTYLLRRVRFYGFCFLIEVIMVI